MSCVICGATMYLVDKEIDDNGTAYHVYRCSKCQRTQYVKIDTKYEPVNWTDDELPF